MQNTSQDRKFSVSQGRKFSLPTKYLYGYLLAFLVSLFFTGVIIFVFGYNPLAAFYYIFSGSLGSTFGIAETLTFLTPLFLCAMSITIAMKCGLTNLGAEGQLYLGSIGAAYAALFLPVPEELRLICVVLFAFLFGAVFALIPAVLRIRYGVSEIFVGLMLNFVGLYLVSFLVEGPWIRPGWGAIPTTVRFPASAELPKLIGGTRLHAGFLLAIFVGIIMYYLFKKTVFGYKVRVVGLGSRVATYSGINTARTALLAMFISGGFAGLAGMVEVSGVHHLLVGDFSPGYGYFAFGAVLMGRLNPAGVGVASFIFSILLGRMEALQRTVGISVSFFYALVAIIILVIISFEPVLRRLR